MKKIGLSILSALLAVFMLFGFVACGEEESASEQSSAISKEDDENEKKIEKLIKTSQVQDMLNQLRTQYASVIDIEIYADKSSLVYDITGKPDFGDEGNEDFFDGMCSAFDSQAYVYENLARKIKDEYDVEDASVVILVKSEDGEEVYRNEFFPSESTDVDIDDSDNGGNSKLSEYIESDIMQEQFEKMNEPVESILDMDVYAADESTLAYKFTYKADISESEYDTIKEQLEENTNSVASTYEAVAESIGAELNIDDMCVRVEYFTNDGTELYSRDFYADGKSKDGVSL